MNNHIWIDEATWFGRYAQTQPTVAETMERFRYWEPSASDHTATRAFDRNAWDRQNESWKQQQDRLRKQQESCLRGHRPYSINWRPGTHPFGPREFWVNIPGTNGGPYLLNDADHQIFHDGRFPHDHLKTTEVGNARARKTPKVFTP